VSLAAATATSSSSSLLCLWGGVHELRQGAGVDAVRRVRLPAVQLALLCSMGAGMAQRGRVDGRKVGCSFVAVLIWGVGAM
jgi:hypothetical protein